MVDGLALPGPQTPSWNFPYRVPWGQQSLCTSCPWYFVQPMQSDKEVIKLKLRCDSVYNQHLLGICCILGPMVVNAEDTKISERFLLGNTSINAIDTLGTGTRFVLLIPVSPSPKIIPC